MSLDKNNQGNDFIRERGEFEPVGSESGFEGRDNGDSGDNGSGDNEGEAKVQGDGLGFASDKELPHKSLQELLESSSPISEAERILEEVEKEESDDSEDAECDAETGSKTRKKSSEDFITDAFTTHRYAIVGGCVLAVVLGILMMLLAFKHQSSKDDFSAKVIPEPTECIDTVLDFEGSFNGVVSGTKSTSGEEVIKTGVSAGAKANSTSDNVSTVTSISGVSQNGVSSTKTQTTSKGKPTTTFTVIKEDVKLNDNNWCELSNMKIKMPYAYKVTSEDLNYASVASCTAGGGSFFVATVLDNAMPAGLENYGVALWFAEMETAIQEANKTMKGVSLKKVLAEKPKSYTDEGGAKYDEYRLQGDDNTIELRVYPDDLTFYAVIYNTPNCQINTTQRIKKSKTFSNLDYKSMINSAKIGCSLDDKKMQEVFDNDLEALHGESEFDLVKKMLKSEYQYDLTEEAWEMICEVTAYCDLMGGKTGVSDIKAHLKSKGYSSDSIDGIIEICKKLEVIPT